MVKMKAAVLKKKDAVAAGVKTLSPNAGMSIKYVKWTNSQRLLELKREIK
jgi:hypothetical protein